MNETKLKARRLRPGMQLIITGANKVERLMITEVDFCRGEKVEVQLENGARLSFDPESMLKNVISDLPVTVYDVPSGRESNWYITQVLTDRWGDLNPYHQESPAAYALCANVNLLNELRMTMVGEWSFVARKDNGFGLLIEHEYHSDVSEENEGCDPASRDGLPHAHVVQTLCKALEAFRKEFHSVSFAVVDGANSIHGRPTVWAFVPHKALDDDTRYKLADRLWRIEIPAPASQPAAA